MKTTKNLKIMKTNQHSTDTYSSNKTYEIAIWTIAFAFFLFLASNLSAVNLNPVFEEENYIDDIPFDTELIYNQLMTDDTEVFSMDEEEYIDDIPFNTGIEVMVINYNQNTGSEETINDIPFNTEQIVMDYYYTMATNETFEFSNEDYINDIPFNTGIEVMVINYNENTGSEETINDIPFNTEQIVMDYYYTMAINETFEFSNEDYINDIPFNTHCIADLANSENGEWVVVN